MLMFMIRQSHLLNEGCVESTLQAEETAFRAAHQEASDAEVLQAVTKRCVPASIPGSPKYHQQKLQDLQAMVVVHGLPHLFVTTTADEFTPTRWGCFDGMETLGRMFNDAFRFQVRSMV
jgi:hypothetical protein